MSKGKNNNNKKNKTVKNTVVVKDKPENTTNPTCEPIGQTTTPEPTTNPTGVDDITPVGNSEPTVGPPTIDPTNNPGPTSTPGPEPSTPPTTAPTGSVIIEDDTPSYEDAGQKQSADESKLEKGQYKVRYKPTGKEFTMDEYGLQTARVHLFPNDYEFIGEKPDFSAITPPAQKTIKDKILA